MDVVILSKKESAIYACGYENYQSPVVEVIEVKNEQNILGGSAPSFGNGGNWNG